MAQRQISFEEANKLFQACLILISQQNLKEKQKINKMKFSPHLSHRNSPLNSPLTNLPRSPKQQISQSLPSELELSSQKSPKKFDHNTCHKLSIDKESSLNDLLEISQEYQLKFVEKEENHSNPSEGHHSHPDEGQKIIQGAQIQEGQKGSQMIIVTESKLYPQSVIKELKRDLEITSRGKICKTQEVNKQTGQIIGYHLYCKNDQDCPFHYYLQYQGSRTQKSQKLYSLTIHCESHLKACLEEEEQIVFIKLTKLIDSLESGIRSLLSQNVELKPKDILNSIAQQLGEENHKFIYKGLQSKHYHKAAKKYFDNLIYKVKNPMWLS